MQFLQKIDWSLKFFYDRQIGYNLARYQEISTILRKIDRSSHFCYDQQIAAIFPNIDSADLVWLDRQVSAIFMRDWQIITILLRLISTMLAKHRQIITLLLWSTDRHNLFRYRQCWTCLVRSTDQCNFYKRSTNHHNFTANDQHDIGKRSTDHHNFDNDLQIGIIFPCIDRSAWSCIRSTVYAIFENIYRSVWFLLKIDWSSQFCCNRQSGTILPDIDRTVRFLQKIYTLRTIFQKVD